MNRQNRQSSIHFQQSAAYERKAPLTRARLMDAAINVIAKVGVDAASIQEITSFAGMAAGTFYLHFKNKDALIDEVGLTITDAVSRAVHDPRFDDEDAAQMVARHMGTFLQVASLEPTWIPVLIHVLHMREEPCDILERGLRDDIEKGRRSNRFDIPDSNEIIAIMLGLCRVGLERMRDGSERRIVQERFLEAALRLMGIAPAESRQIVQEILQSSLLQDIEFPAVSIIRPAPGSAST